MARGRPFGKENRLAQNDPATDRRPIILLMWLKHLCGFDTTGDPRTLGLDASMARGPCTHPCTPYDLTLDRLKWHMYTWKDEAHRGTRRKYKTTGHTRLKRKAENARVRDLWRWVTDIQAAQSARKYEIRDVFFNGHRAQGLFNLAHTDAPHRLEMRPMFSRAIPNEIVRGTKVSLLPPAHPGPRLTVILFCRPARARSLSTARACTRTNASSSKWEVSTQSSTHELRRTSSQQTHDTGTPQFINCACVHCATHRPAKDWRTFDQAWFQIMPGVEITVDYGHDDFPCRGPFCRKDLWSVAPPGTTYNGAVVREPTLPERKQCIVGAFVPRDPDLPTMRSVWPD